MAPGSKAPQLKWTQEEYDVLIEMTNDQLKLEAQDASMQIPWSTHWKNVSSRLKELGCNRTPTACRGIWRRGVQEQQANREAAGQDWDETEHEILVHMTKKQLELEEADPANVIPWPKHWKKVSLQLDESGYVRTPNNCDAYWQLVENDVMEDPSGLGGEDDGALDDVDEGGESPEAKARVENEEEAPASGLAVALPQASSKTGMWSLEEYECLLSLLKARRQLEARERLEILIGSRFWTEISRSHQANGFDRSWEACKTFWSRQGRQRSGYDERVEHSAKSGIQSTIQPISESSATNSSTSSNAAPSSDRSKPPSLSSLWSPVNETDVEESIVVSLSPVIDVFEKFQKNHSDLSPDVNSAVPKSTAPVVNDLRPDQEQAQKKRGASLNSTIPTHEIPDKSSSAANHRIAGFRFTSEQRAVLEAEALRTGGTVDSSRRVELAKDLGVEEKTVRNWFNSHNVKARRSQGSTPTAPVPTPTYNDFQESTKHRDIQAAATPTPLNKDFADFSGIIPKRSYPDDGTPGHSRPSKKTQQYFHPANGTSNWHRSHDPSTATPSGSGRPVSQQSALPAEDLNLRSFSNAPIQTNRSSNSTSSIPPGTVQSSEFTAIPQKGTKDPVLPPPLQLNSSSQPTSNPESHQTAPSVTKQQPLAPTPHPTTTAYPSILCGNDNLQTNSSGLTNSAQIPLPQPVKTKTYGPYVWSRNPTAQNSRATMGLQPRPKSPEPAASVPASKVSPIGTTGAIQTSPNRERATQFSAETDKHKEPLANSKPVPTPLPFGDAHSITPATHKEQPNTPDRPIARPAPIQNPSPRPRIASTPSHEDSRVIAARHVESFRSEIENLMQASAARAARIASLSQELLNYSNKHTELNAAKDAEVARILKEVDTRYEGLHTGVRQHEEWLEKEKSTEAEGTKKDTAELSKKEKGLAKWQGLVEYYDSEGEEEP